MKTKTILFLFSLLTGLSIQIKAQTQPGYALNCIFKGLPDKTKVYLTTQERDTVQKVLSDGDKFTFKGRLDPEGRFLFIQFDTLVTKIVSKAIFVSNKIISVNGSVYVREIDIKGSPEQEEYHQSLEMEKNFNNNVTALLNNKDKDSASIRLEYEALGKKNVEDNKQWFINHKESLVIPYLVMGWSGVIGVDISKDIFEKLSKNVKDSYYGRQLKETIVASSSGIKQDAVIADIAVLDTEGNSKNILDLVKNNKLTLIDCWASWCAPCRAEVPELKKMYAKYKGKGFNILGISSDKVYAEWKKAMKEDKTTWAHFIEDKKTQLVTKAFDLRSIPAYILVDGKGKLIAFDRAMSTIAPFGGSLRGEHLDKKLEELLGK